jgi:type II secretory pathway predicted ATPase ExeA
LVIDEAQDLSTEAHEAIHLLTNFETPAAKLIQIVLSGQPQLAETLAKPAISQLQQRISTLCRLVPFPAAEVNAYIGHRVKMAGYTRRPLFTPDAIALVVPVSRGTPGLNQYALL